ncbi:PfkB family carbohydrate kinase [Escherichia coli]
MVDQQTTTAQTNANFFNNIRLTTMSKKIAVIGECMIELSEKGADVKRGFGGDTLNTSVYIARQVDPCGINRSLRNGAWEWRVQPADAGRLARRERYTSPTVRMENRLPGLYYIETDSTGERTFYYWRTKPPPNSGLESEQSAAIWKSWRISIIWT